jgi:zinc/manganese transport system substrate-binding protein/manganese/iron transport system substrate-binding protein
LKRILRESGVSVLEMATYLDLIRVDKVIAHGDHTHDMRGGDPHVWLDPLKGIVLAEMIAAHLSRIDPAGAAMYSANAAAYALELEAIHTAYEDTFSQLSPERRKLVVFHDAYAYFAARYGFEIVGIVLPNPEGEPSAGQIAELIGTIEAEGIDVIFAEPQFDTDPLDVVVAETGIQIGLLMTDTFSEDVDSYLDLLRFNLHSLQAHLASS